jgi:general secretion pathway protein G
LKVYRRGFTLVELLIVVIIIGIIAAVVVPGFAGASGESSASATATDLRAFQRATQAWALDLRGDLPLMNSEFKDGIQAYLMPGATDKKPAIGGDFGFHVSGSTDHAAIGIWGTPYPNLRISVDEFVDDGNLDTGSLRQGPNNGLLFLVFGEASTYGWP